MEIVIVPHDSRLYREAVAVRREVLRVPLGLEFSPEELARESAHRHLVALEEGEVSARTAPSWRGGHMRASVTLVPAEGAPSGRRGHIPPLVGVVVGCLMIVLEPEARIRQMAVRPRYQGKGIGRALMLAAEREIIALGKTQIVLHARETAIGFYEKLGFLAEGERFLEVNLGHRLMRKRLPSGGEGQEKP